MGDAAVKSAMMEPATLPWPGDRMSVRSDVSLREAASWTESERGEEAGLRTQLEAEPAENHLPEKAAQVFSPAVTVLHSTSSPRGSEAFWEMEDILKVGVSLMTSALLFPFLVWGGYVFLPFDAPLLDGAPLRLVYALRCSVFAAAPVVLGWLVLGVGRLRSGALVPPFDHDEEEAKGAEPHEVAVHRRFVSDSASLFLIYFLQLAVMAMYLSQEQLKLVPLLSIRLFCVPRLVYWVAAAFGSSIRGFGFGLSFLPSVAMMAANFYFIFTVEASGSIFSLPAAPAAPTPPGSRQRFYG
uniref:Transmembrane protein 79b n=1 Tax=Cyclopterus lumpus TaxID=8103 RepID=A0A8C3ALJ0_CYCLU